ncbi:aminoglycoside 6'-N-acetyltransferase [Lacticaseibacillus parakribbianus]|uniref:aminoglycoside 6'-N-acetyltransferase n=1 Tax=Lacticaseibacillus parakribbianus TaxID=2970927 RepID=UPI0021CB8C6E|nr:aminoglycoside 6'-N-acetyltransferase [Lacticaseibacillus parakribbianus]
MLQLAGPKDLDQLAELAALMWPHHEVCALRAEIASLIAQGQSQFFLIGAMGSPVGFAQCSLRHDYVEGTSTSPVGYLEGIFVKPTARHRGYAKALVASCEAWAKAQGCAEFASDCPLDHLTSLRFHQALHFTEANRIICFTKAL